MLSADFRAKCVSGLPRGLSRAKFGLRSEWDCTPSMNLPTKRECALSLNLSAKQGCTLSLYCLLFNPFSMFFLSDFLLISFKVVNFFNLTLWIFLLWLWIFIVCCRRKGRTWTDKRWREIEKWDENEIASSHKYFVLRLIIMWTDYLLNF